MLQVGAGVEVTVKCRLGVDARDSYEELHEFISTVAAAGVRHFIVHARKAILGLDTVKNRSVPPLRHEWVLRLVADFPRLKFTLNGGVTSVEQVVHAWRAAPAHSYRGAISRIVEPVSSWALCARWARCSVRACTA